MMTFVEHDSCRTVRDFAAARGIDHDERVIGNDEVGIDACPRRALDEAFPVMRTSGIDAFAAAVGQRGRACAAKQRGEPARHVTTDHIAVTAERCPARDEVRKDRGTTRKSALQGLLEVEQAQVILAPLADHDFRFALGGIGKQATGFTVQLALQRFGIGRNPDGSARFVRPKRSGAEIGQRLADPGARFGKQHIGFVAARARFECCCCRFGIGALSLAPLGTRAGQIVQSLERAFGRNADRARCGAWGFFLPFDQLGEQPALVFAGSAQCIADDSAPRPAQARKCLRRCPCAFALGPLECGHSFHQCCRDQPQHGRRATFIDRRRNRQCLGKPLDCRHDEPRRMDEREQLEQIEAVKIGIAQPLSDERRIEQNDRRFGCFRNGFPASDPARAIVVGDPDAAVACVKRGVGQRRRH